MFRALLAVIVIGSLLATGEAAVQTKTLQYKVGDQEFIGHLAWDDSVSGKRPGILVVHEWWGLNDYARGRADQLAKLGYVAFACDMYGGGKTAEHPSEAGQMATQVRQNVEEWQKRANVALDLLKQQPQCDPSRLAAIGYCFGGSTALMLAYSGADLDAVVTFHAGIPLPTPEQARAIKASLVICNGALDSLIPEKTIQQFRKALDDAHVDYEIDYYAGSKHSFTVPDADKHGIPGLSYNKKADERSWNRMLRLFEEKFGKSAAGTTWYDRGHGAPS
jgi:dienelactone hydrolase